MAVTKPTNNYQFPFPAQEFVGHGNPLSGSFANGVSQFTEQWQFNFSAFTGGLIVSTILGYSTQGGASMKRVLPVKCSQFPWLYASRVTGPEGIASRGQAIGVNAGGAYAAFQQMRITIQYESMPYDILSDASVQAKNTANKPAESWRYVIWERQPASEFIQNQETSFVWPQQVHNRQRDVLLGSKGYAILLSKVRIVATWVQVCDDWVRNGSNRFGNLEACLGTVNNQTFLDYPRGTLLFESYKPIPRVEPVDPVVMNQVNKISTVPRGWDIVLTWVYFDPTNGQSNAGNAGNLNDNNGTPAYGHNLVFDPITAKWWRPLLNSTGGFVPDASGYWRYAESDHSQIFKQYT